MPEIITHSDLRDFRSAFEIESLERRLLFATYSFQTLASYQATDAPVGSPTLDASGNIYGLDNLGTGAGNAFELPKGSSTPIELATFASGVAPQSIVSDAAGNLFGIEQNGGNLNEGAIYSIARGSGVITTLASFGGAYQLPHSTILVDPNDNVFGVAYGTSSEVVWELPAGSNSITTVASAPADIGFADVSVMDRAGNLFCTGVDEPDGAAAFSDCILEIPAGSATPTVLGVFDGSNGFSPLSGMALDPAGDLFGAATGGGDNGDGVIFEVVAGSNAITELAPFDGNNSASPTFGVVRNANGDLFGTTSLGGANNEGVIYQLANGSSAIVSLMSFSSGQDSYIDGLNGGLAIDTGGNLIGFASPHFAVTGSVYELASGSTTATQLAFVAEPSTGTAGVTLNSSITVAIEDAGGNPVIGDDSLVTLSIAAGPSDTALSGTLSVAAVNGVATFSNVSFEEEGSYTLEAADGTLMVSGIEPIDVSPAVSSPPQSQIVPTLPKITLPPSAVAGATVNASVSILMTNTGVEPKGVYTIELYFDAGTTLDGNQALVGRLSKNLALKTGQSKTIQFRVKSIPSSLTDGTYHLLAEVIDPMIVSSVVASDQTIAVAAPFVALSAAVVDVSPTSIKAGSSGLISVVIFNGGNINATGSASIALSASTNGDTSPAGTALATAQQRVTLKPGQRKTIKVHFKTASLTPGSYRPYVSILLDGQTISTVGSNFTIT